MARFVKEAQVDLTWSDGPRVKMGTLKVCAEVSEMHLTGMRKIRQRIGWELVRKGFRIMLPGKEWRTEFDPE